MKGINESAFYHGSDTALHMQQHQQKTIMNQQTQLQQHQYQLQLQQQQYQLQKQKEYEHEQKKLQQKQKKYELEQQKLQQQFQLQQQQLQQQQQEQLQLQQQQQRMYQSSQASHRAEEEYFTSDEQFEQQDFRKTSQLNLVQHNSKGSVTTYQSLNRFNHSQVAMTQWHEIDPTRNEPQLLRSMPNYLAFSERQPAHLEIEVSGTPNPVVTWYKDGLLVRNSPEAQISSNSGLHVLYIPEMYYEDSGIYKAVIASPLGILESICEINVEGFILIFFRLYKIFLRLYICLFSFSYKLRFFLFKFRLNSKVWFIYKSIYTKRFLAFFNLLFIIISN